ncbi:MAG TPA: hypothetical protein DDZ67_08880 [Xanthomonadaceae bacterium]|nr:hypothetical protein [Xanthomonadaceae bacterium]
MPTAARSPPRIAFVLGGRPSPAAEPRDGAVATWRTPAPFVDGDDERDVDVDQGMALVRRLRGRGMEAGTLIVVGDPHHGVRDENQSKVNAANAIFLAPPAPGGTMTGAWSLAAHRTLIGYRATGSAWPTGRSK